MVVMWKVSGFAAGDFDHRATEKMQDHMLGNAFIVHFEKLVLDASFA